MKKGLGDGVLSALSKGGAEGHRVTESSVGKPLRSQHQARAETTGTSLCGFSPHLRNKEHNQREAGRPM